MPFGAMFAAIVFGLVGLRLAIPRLLAPDLAFRMIGASLAVLGVALAAGLLTRRSWARWLGAISGPWFAYFALPLVAHRPIAGFVVILAALLSSILLLVPATGRFEAPGAAAPPADPAGAPAAPAMPRRAAGRRILPAVAGVAFATLCLGFAWAAIRAPRPPAAVRGAAADAERSPVAWSDFAAGVKAAKSGRKLVVADFYATWCGPCKLMARETFTDPRVVARLKDVVPVRVDSEEEVPRDGVRGVDLATRYGIDVYPTIVVVDGDGREVARNQGFLSADEFLSWLDAVLERAGSAVARS